MMTMKGKREKEIWREGREWSEETRRGKGSWVD
jgi:hypothetical protein